MRTESSTRNRGFTFIELCVMIVIISVLASMIMPNLLKARDARIRHDFEAQLFRLAANARERAIQQKETLALTMDGHTFNIVREPDPNQSTTGTPNSNSTNNTSSTTEDEVVSSAQMPDGLDTGSMSAEGSDESGGNWRLRFYPDGTTDGGGVELNDAGRIRSLQIKTDGTLHVIEGSLPDTGSTKWSAGEIEKRVQQQ